MGGLSIWKLLLILLVAILIFGGRRLPELGKSLGTGIVNFRKAVKDDEPPDQAAEPKAEPDSNNTV